MARLRLFVAAMAFWLSIASADMASHAHSSTNCTFAERNIKFCRPYLQKANRTLRPSRTCCFVALSIYLVGPECFCDVVNPSSLGVPVNASRVSRLPKLCHLPKGALHCNATRSPARERSSLSPKASPEPSASPVPRRSPPPVAHPPPTSPPTPVSSPPANPPSSSISTPPSNPPATPTTDPPSGSVAVTPSNPPSGSVSAPPSNPPSGSVSAPPSGSTAAPPSKPPSGSGAEPPSSPPSGSIATPPSNPPTPSVAAPPSWATAPSLSPYSPGHPSETAPAAAPTSSDALKLATSAVGLFVAFASVVVCM